MSRNKPPRPNSHTFDAIKSILSESLWLKQNESEVIKQLTEISKRTLGVEKCSKFRVKEGELDYGVFNSTEIELHGFCSKDAGEFCWPIDELYWQINLRGLGEMLNKYHPTKDNFGEYEYDIPNDDELCGVGIILNPKTHKLAIKIYYSDYKFTLIPIYDE